MKKYVSFSAVALLSLALLSGCGGTKDAGSTDTKTNASEKAENSSTQKITYLGKQYEVPKTVNSFIAASFEPMEDAAILGLKPSGVVSVDGKTIPEYLKASFPDAKVVGDKFEPDVETMLNLNSDIILGTDKWDEDVIEKYNKIAPTIPYTFHSEHWKENLHLLGNLVGKDAEVKDIIDKYDVDTKEAKAKIKEQFGDATALVIRVRGGMQTYGPKLYLSSQIYDDLGFAIPKEIQKQKQQTEISMETLAKINPDFIFIQFEKNENKNTPEAMKEIEENPIFSKLKASKDKHVYKNIIDPFAQGGTAWSKVKFLEAINKDVLK